MPVSKAVMANGSFTLGIKAASPSDIRSAVDIQNSAFAHLVVLPARLDASWTTAATLFSKSIYTGVVFSNETGLALKGHHATSWLEDPAGLGPLIERASSPLTKTFLDWFTWTISVQTALVSGSVANLVSGSSLTYDPQYVNPRAVLDRVVEWMRTISSNYTVEWRVTDDLKLDGGTTADIYTTTPRALLTPSFDGPDITYPGIQSNLTYTDDVEDYLTREVFEYTGGSRVGVNGTATSWQNGQGQPVSRVQSDSDSSLDSAWATQKATTIVKARDYARRQIDATTNRYGVMLDVPTGAYLYAWDQDNGIYDLANKIEWRGTIATPLAVRVMQIDMPVETGMGVYLIKNGSTVTDLTDWFVPESPGARLTLGALRRRYAL